jgi:hypothetical protein
MKKLICLTAIIWCAVFSYASIPTVNNTGSSMEEAGLPTFKICFKIWKGAKFCITADVSIETETIYKAGGNISESLDLKRMNSDGVYMKDGMLIITKDVVIPNNEIEDMEPEYDVVLKAGKYRINKGNIENILLYFK